MRWIASPRGGLGLAFAVLTACSEKPEATLRVEPLAPSIELGWVSLVVEPGGAAVSAAPNSPALLRDLEPRTKYEAHVEGDVLADPVAFTTEDQGRVSATLRVIPITREPLAAPGGKTEIHSEVRFDGSGTRWLIWKRQDVVLQQVELPSKAASMQRVFREQWLYGGSHRDPADGKRDPLVVYMDPQTPPAQILATCRAALSVKREFRTASGMTEQAAFAVSVRPKLRPR